MHLHLTTNRERENDLAKQRNQLNNDLNEARRRAKKLEDSLQVLIDLATLPLLVTILLAVIVLSAELF